MTPLDPGEIPLYRYGEDLSPEYWERLRTREPQEICRSARVEVTPLGAYRIPFLGMNHICDPTLSRIFPESIPEVRLSFQTYLVILIYLLQARDLPLQGEWVNEKQLRGGALFFQGPHALAREPLEQRYARDPRGFLRAGQALGGEAGGLGDASFTLAALPRIPLQYVFHAEDDEFPAQLTVLFDRTIEEHLPLDVIWALVNIVSHQVWKAGEKER